MEDAKGLFSWKFVNIILKMQIIIANWDLQYGHSNGGSMRRHFVMQKPLHGVKLALHTHGRCDSWRIVDALMTLECE